MKASALELVRQELPEAAKDVRLNLQSVLETTSLTPAQKWGVAIASAIAAKSPRLRDAVVADAMAEVDAGVIEDARAAAVLMAMNNVYYRFRHIVGKPSYQTKSPRLRMNRLAQVLGNKVDFELISLAVSAINGCEVCVKSHEKAVIDGGLTEEHVHDAVRVAATVNAAAVALLAS
jgi:lipoyl-dependent peroxiredoxin subunit D